MTLIALRSLDLRNPVFRKLGVALVMAAAILLNFGDARAHAEEIKVAIDNFTFSPVELKLKVGDTVTWTNRDDIPHTVVSGQISLQDHGYGRDLLVHLHFRGRLQVFLLAPPTHDRNDQG